MDSNILDSVVTESRNEDNGAESKPRVRNFARCERILRQRLVLIYAFNDTVVSCES